MLIDESELCLKLNAIRQLLAFLRPLSSCCFWPPAPALADDAAKGKATFISICSSCHGLDGIATLDYAPSFAEFQRLDQDDAKLLVSVRDGIGVRMPPWGTSLSQQETLDAITYARTFCKRAPPQRPAADAAH